MLCQRALSCYWTRWARAWVLSIFLLGAAETGGWAVEAIELETPPLQVQGVTMVPARSLLEWLGAKTEEKEGRITAALGEGEEQQSIAFTVGKREAKIGGEETVLGTPPIMRGGVAYLPLQAVCDAFGATSSYAAGCLTLSRGDKSGCCYLPIEALPAAYSFDRYLKLAKGQESLGDAARKQEKYELARRHFHTALYATRAIHREETRDNPWYLSEVCLRQAYQASMSDDIAALNLYTRAAEELMAQAMTHKRGLKSLQASVDRATRADTLAARLKAKLAKCPPQ